MTHESRYGVVDRRMVSLGSDSVSFHYLEGFLDFAIERDQLSIGQYLDDLMSDGFFLVAATGLGKTVVVPVHALLLAASRGGRDAAQASRPRVWVVEPRIAIATEQCDFMNLLWTEYKGRHRKVPPLFGSISSKGVVNGEASIMFITTGIFEAKAQGAEFDPRCERVLVDEAHVTLEQNVGVEVAVAACQRANVPIDYMSATVDTSDLEDSLVLSAVVRADKQRYPIWKHNLNEPMMDALPLLVRSTLVECDLSSEYYPRGSNDLARDLRSVVRESRSHGLMVIVNSFDGFYSDIPKLSRLLHGTVPEVAVLELTSAVVRDRQGFDNFQRRLQQLERSRENYVVLATSVVEMGITLSSLDYVVTMDSGFATESVDGVVMTSTVPLGTNALMQRFGRVGRRRPGLAYVSNEVGAFYSSLSDDELNSQALSYEPIAFPLAYAPLESLAYACTKAAAREPSTWLAEQRLPSRIEQSSERQEQFLSDIDRLVRLGVRDAAGGGLTDLGRRIEWSLGRLPLPYAVRLIKSTQEDAEPTELDTLFWMVAAVHANDRITSLRAENDFFVDHAGVHKEIAHDIEIWMPFGHEDLAAIYAFASIAARFPFNMFGRASESDKYVFSAWGNACGLRSAKFTALAVAVREVQRQMSRNQLLPQALRGPLRGQPWSELMRWISVRHDELQSILTKQMGASAITICTDDKDRITWQERHGGRSGLASQDQTPVALRPGNYTAVIVPRRDTRDGVVTWDATHIGAAQATLHPTGGVVKPAIEQRTEKRRLVVQPTSTKRGAKPTIRERLGAWLRQG